MGGSPESYYAAKGTAGSDSAGNEPIKSARAAERRAFGSTDRNTAGAAIGNTAAPTVGHTGRSA